MQQIFYQKTTAIHKKRRSFQPLTQEEFIFLLADCILDRQLFASPNWNWRYGGVRYVPNEASDSDPSKILVLQWPGALGDVAMSAPVFSVLRRKYPHAEISFLSGKTAQDIFMGNPDIDVLIDNPLDSYLDKVMYERPIDLKALLRDTAGVTELLAKNEVDLLVNLQVLPMSAVLARLSGAKHTIGMTLTSDGMSVIRGNIWAAYLFGVSAGLMRRYNLLHRTEIFRLMIDEQREFVPDPTLYINDVAAEKVQTFLDLEGIGDRDLVVGINPMAGTPIRQWGHYDELAEKIRDDLRAKVIVFGAKDEEDMVNEIVRRSGKDVIKATRFNLQELMAAICGCDLFITNDTGPMHLACLFKRKVIALFGPTSVREVGPWQTEFHILQSSTCRECYKQECAYPEKYCMDQIGVEDVYRIVAETLNKRATSVKDDLFGNNIIYWSSKCLPNLNSHHAEDTFLGRAILQVFNGGKRFAENAISVNSGACKNSDDLIKEYKKNRTLAKEAIERLEDPSNANLKKLSSIKQSIFGVNALFKPIVVLNDLRFLDKRLILEQDLVANQRFYRAVIEDVELLMSCLTAEPKKEQSAKHIERGLQTR